MELAQSIVLNEEALSQLPELKKPVFVYEWLRYLERVLVAAQKSDIKESQTKLVEQLTGLIISGPGPPTRRLLAKCLATLFSVGDTFSLFGTINSCNDILKSKDDSANYMATKLAAICCVGAMYEKLGRMVGRSFEDTTQILLKCLKSAESLMRMEIMETLQKMIVGLGSAGQSVHRDVYKATRNCLVDRFLAVRCLAAKCLLSICEQSQTIVVSETDNIVSSCLKGLEGSNYETRCAIAELLGVMLAIAYDPKLALESPSMGPKSSTANQLKTIPLDDCLQLLATGFCRGGSGFLKDQRSLSKEIRQGLSMAYVEFFERLGSKCLERHLSVFSRHMIDLGSLGKTSTGANPVEAIFVRRCISFVLRQTIGKLLGEKAQHSACREIGHYVAELGGTMDVSTEGPIAASMIDSQNSLICALYEIACLVQQLGNSCAPLFLEASGIMEPIYGLLVHPLFPVRIAVAWTLRCVTIAIPSLITPLIDRSVNRIEHMKDYPDAVSGYSLLLSGLIGGAYKCNLGIPHTKGKQVFITAEELLKSASQNPKLTQPKTKAAWLMIAAVCTLGPATMRPLLPRILTLIRSALPKSAKEFETEKGRGDQFTWKNTFESRAGALCAMQSLFTHCKEIVSDELVKRLIAPLDGLLAMLAYTPQLIKQYGVALVSPYKIVRLRLYNALSQLKAKNFEVLFSPLLREIVADFTLTDNSNVLTSSLLREMCHHDDRVILGSWLQDTDHRMIEEQMEPNRKAELVVAQPLSASASGALEHDSYLLCCRDGDNEFDIPSPLPLSVAIIDSAVRIFGQMFPLVPAKHRLQMLEHFGDCIKQAKGARQQAMQINIFTALLCSLKQLAEQKGSFETEAVRKAALNLILSNLSAQNPVLRCAAAEALGRVAQVVGDPRFVAELAQFSFDRLKACREVTGRTGYSLSLGCLHRYVGGLGSGQHLNTSISILLALSQDSSSPVVQIWALHALGLIADSGGPMFRGYVEPSLSLCLKLLLSTSSSHPDVYQCIGKLTSALITTVGPELQNNIGSIVATRSSFLAACAIMSLHDDPLVQAEAIACLQQLHMFAPRHVNLSSLVPQLCEMLFCRHLILRRAAASCLRQLAQREAREIHDHAQVLVPVLSSVTASGRSGFTLPDTGLEGAMFGMLDVESDFKLRENVKETIISSAQCLAVEQLMEWLNLCKGILAATSTEQLGATSQDDKTTSNDVIDDDDENNDDGDDSSRIGPQDQEQGGKTQILPRWPTRIFAVEIVRKIIQVCENERAHFDLALAKELQYSSCKSDYLVLHLSDLVRMAFMAATSDSSDLRLAGLGLLTDIIDRFAAVPEPEFPGHVILEQFQAQVGAALRPAFSPDTPSDVTAAACEVCSTWIGSDVARDLNDLRRVHQLLVSSLKKLKKGSISTQLYSDSAATLEKLSILKAWAEVYIVASKEAKRGEKSYTDSPDQSESLLNLVTPELSSLIGHWLAVLKDYAFLSLPAEYAEVLPVKGGAYYTSESIDSVRAHYRQAWAPILLASTTWLKQNRFELPEHAEAVESEASSHEVIDGPAAKMSVKEKRFYLILGTCMEAVCSPRSLEKTENVQLCLESMRQMFDCPFPRQQLMANEKLAIELLNVLHRLILTREFAKIQSLTLDVLDSIVISAENHVQSLNNNDKKMPKNGEIVENKKYLGFESKIEPGNSVVFAALEVCLCSLVRQIPQVNPAMTRNKSAFLSHHRKYGRLTQEAHELIAKSLNIMVRLPDLCSNDGAISILPIVFYLLIACLRETSKAEKSQFNVQEVTGHISLPAATSIQCLKQLANKPILTDGENVEDPSANLQLSPKWSKIIQSSMWEVLHIHEKTENSITVDPVAQTLALAVFVLYAPSKAIMAKNVTKLCIDFLRDGVTSCHAMLQQKCLQTLQSIFAIKDPVVSNAYILGLSPLIFNIFKSFSSEFASNSGANGEISMHNLDFFVRHGEKVTENVVAVMIEAEKCLEVIISVANEAKRHPLIEISMKLIMLVVDNEKCESESQVSKCGRALKETSLGKIVGLGQTYPTQFKKIVVNNANLKQRLDSLLKNMSNQKSTKSALNIHSPISANGSPAVDSKTTMEAPKIKLTMDFSSFSGAK